VDEVELFVMAERMLVEVLGRIGPPDRRTVAGPVADSPGWDTAATLPEWSNRIAAEERRLTERLGGTPPEAADLPTVVEATCAAARSASSDVDLTEASALRCFLAQDVAMALGSRACPLPEDLAHGLLERMEPAAERWRSAGVFRERLPLPDGHVSWRDRFLLLAGRDPHPSRPA
jgi:hypothetical protein